MSLTMKERYARLDMSKLPNEYQEQFKVISDGTENFSDDDLNEVFAENFKDLYDLVESRYPEAIQKGGTIKKEKPSKVKKVRAKKEKKEPEYKPKNVRRKLSEKDIMDIEGALAVSNAEKVSDIALVKELMQDFDISQTQAEKWVAKRDKYKDTAYGDYHYRKESKKEARRKSDKNIVKTRDGYEFNRKDPSNKGLKFFDENGKEWTCKKYEPKLDECIFTDEKGKEISSCLKDMYVNNPVVKREKGNLVDECKETLKEAGYTVKIHKTGKKKISRKEPRPEKEIVKEKVENTFTTITKDLTKSEESQKENKAVIDTLGRIEKLFIKVMNRISNLADDGKAEKLEKIEKLLKELID